MSNVLNQIQEKASDLYVSERGGNEMIDPATAIMLLEVVVEVIKMLKACKESREGAEAKLKKPSIVDRAIFKRFLRNKVGIKKIKQDPALQESCIKLGQVLTKEEIDYLWLENN